MTPLETTAMELLLAGGDPVLETLRRQLAAARVERRDRTAVGFFTHFALPENAPRLERVAEFVLDDVAAEIEGLERTARFLLFVKEGALGFLEGVAFGEGWPDEAGMRRAYYLHCEPGDGHVAIETARRDLEGVRRRWSG